MRNLYLSKTIQAIYFSKKVEEAIRTELSLFTYLQIKSVLKKFESANLFPGGTGLIADLINVLMISFKKLNMRVAENCWTANKSDGDST